MSVRLKALGAVFACAFSASSLLAQTAHAPAAAAPGFPTKPERVAGVRYLTIETITAKPGAQLWTIISKHFIPAAKAAGLPMPLFYHTDTGKPATIIIAPLTGGPDDLGWSATADDVKFMTALAKLEGGQDKALAMFKHYNDSIESRTRELIHERTK